MAMYRIIHRESGLIYSEELGWVKEHGEMYGHCFEWVEAELIGKKLSAEGIPVEIKKDKVASSFERVVNFSFPKLLLMTLIGFAALFIAIYLTKDIPFSKTEDPVTEIKNAFNPIFIPIFIVGAISGIFLLFVVLKYGRD